MRNITHGVILIVFLSGVLFFVTSCSKEPETNINYGILSLPDAEWSRFGTRNGNVIFILLNNQNLINSKIRKEAESLVTIWGIWFERHVLQDGRIFDLHVDLSNNRNKLTYNKQVFNLEKGSILMLRDDLSLTLLPVKIIGSHNKQETKDVLNAIYVGYRSMNNKDRQANQANSADANSSAAN